jgi:lipid-binding SYLF domain-containing protein
MRFNYIFFTTIILLLAANSSKAAEVQDYSRTIKIYEESPLVREFFYNSYGYAVFPTVGKGAFTIGAAYGRGQVYRGGRVTGNTALYHLSIGFQLGGQAFSQIIFFQDKRAYDEFTSGSFEFEANASAVVITAGAQAQVGTKGSTAGASAGPATGAQARTTYVKGMAVFVHAIGGLMYELALGGQRFTFESL